MSHIWNRVNTVVCIKYVVCHLSAGCIYHHCTSREIKIYFLSGAELSRLGFMTSQNTYANLMTIPYILINTSVVLVWWFFKFKFLVWL